jgi:hypothetical protein
MDDAGNHGPEGQLMVLRLKLTDRMSFVYVIQARMVVR